MNTKELERRVLNPQACELRVDDSDGDSPKIRGYAATFNNRSEDLGGWFEIIERGAFGESLKNGADVRALLEHDSRAILGRNKAGTLGLKEDKTGLAIEIDPPDTTAGRDAIESIKRGDLTGMSFGFRTIDDRWETKDGAEVRTLLKVDLFDVSIVAYPAYGDTSVALRSLELWQEQHEVVICDGRSIRRLRVVAVDVVPTPKRNAARLRLAEVDSGESIV